MQYSGMLQLADWEYLASMQSSELRSYCWCPAIISRLAGSDPHGVDAHMPSQGRTLSQKCCIRQQTADKLLT